MSVCALVSTYSVLSQLLLIRYGKFRYPNRSIVRLINLLQVVDQTFHVRTSIPVYRHKIAFVSPCFYLFPKILYPRFIGIYSSGELSSWSLVRIR